MFSKILEKIGVIEVTIRILSDKFPGIKFKIKKLRKKSDKEYAYINEVDKGLWNSYKKRIYDVTDKDDIIIIHSSMDGLASIGVNEDTVIQLLNELVKRGNTIVIPAFPITNLKFPDKNSKPYDPKRTICWTGMLPNIFLADKNTVRSEFPYNSLAAKGPKAKEIMEDNLKAEYVYGRNSAWDYCLKYRAKILFLGVKASVSNTMAIHMIPDVMEDEWPIDGWYEEITYKVKIDDKVINKSIKVQKGFWYKYCMEERTSGRLKEAGILYEEKIGNAYFGYVHDSQDMVSELMTLCKRNKLMYLVPSKYYKKHLKNKY